MQNSRAKVLSEPATQRNMIESKECFITDKKAENHTAHPSRFFFAILYFQVYFTGSH